MMIQMLNDYDDVLKPVDLMKILQVGRNTVYRMLKDEEIKSISIGGKYRIPKTFLLNYFESHQTSTKKEA